MYLLREYSRVLVIRPRNDLEVALNGGYTELIIT